MLTHYAMLPSYTGHPEQVAGSGLLYRQEMWALQGRYFSAQNVAWDTLSACSSSLQAWLQGESAPRFRFQDRSSASPSLPFDTSIDNPRQAASSWEIAIPRRETDGCGWRMCPDNGSWWVPLTDLTLVLNQRKTFPLVGCFPEPARKPYYAQEELGFTLHVLPC